MEPSYSNNPVSNQTVKSGGGNEKIMAIASLVLGVINLCAWFLPICGIPLAFVGLVLGVMGLKDPSQKTLAIIGIALCGLSLLLGCGNAAYGAYIGYTQGLQGFAP